MLMLSWRPYTVTRAQFIKMFIRAMYGADAVNIMMADFNHWAAKDIKKAEEIGVLATREYYINNIDQPITRAEMAKLIIRAYMQFEPDPFPYEESKVFSSVIKDYHQIPAEYQPSILMTYATGIITGYPDGRFGGNDTATRAQAAAFIIRYLDKNERIKVEKPTAGSGTGTGKREATILRWDDPYRPVPQEGDIFIKPDGTEVVLKIGPAGVLGENQNCDIWGGMAYPSGNVLKEGMLGIPQWGHLGETYLIDDYGEGHFWEEWKMIMKYYGNKAYEDVKNPKEGQTYGKWLIYMYGQWCWIGPINLARFS